MLPFSRSTLSLLVAAGLLLPLASCANSSWSESLQKAFEADPKLRTTAPGASPAGTATPTKSPSPVAATQVQLPADFPSQIPLYPNRELRQVVESDSQSSQATDPATNPSDSNPSSSSSPQEVTTRWVSGDSSDRVLSFYRNALQTNDWKLLEKPSDDMAGTLVAQQSGLQVTVTVQPIASLAPVDPTRGNPERTQFEIQYARATEQGKATPSSSPSGAAGKGNLATLSGFSESTLAGASGDSQPQPPAEASTYTASAYTDLAKTPKELRQYVEDLAKLGVLSATPARDKTDRAKDSHLFEPNKSITRREFARWLVAANNRLFTNRPTQQIRLGLESSKPVFQDVPSTDRDFAAIQGLVEAGLIPSPLSGDSTTVTFRPDAPLTRETLLLWKVPVDTRQPLPIATIQAVKETWGFQDAARIDAKALKAVLADFQNGDQANIRRAFGYTTLFQPKKTVTRAEAAAALWYFGYQGEGRSAQDALKGT